MRFMLRTGIFSILLFSIFGLKAQNCPEVFNPVVAQDGRTFLNACFAEAAGVNFYTQGVAFSDCINPDRMDPSANCAVVYQPVVGCNGAVYANACEAEKHGVLSYMPQNAYAMSNGDIENCFDYQKVANAFPTAFNYSNGTVSINCGTANEPVCGCNGIQYRNPCEAEASGVVDYTYGNCGSVCVIPEDVNTGDPSACPPDFDPVCGCNQMTYINSCAAQNSGVQDFSQGNCSGTAWQRKATVLLSGQQVTGNINSNNPNDITLFEDCSPESFEASENVYVIHKTQPGDLQVIMDINTPGVDLDLFVVNGMRNSQCLDLSTNPVNQNMEKVVVKNAPIGTYFIVVDAQNPSASGSYSLQAAAGYFDSEKVLEIDCGIPMATSNIGGSNNAITFSCDGQNVSIGSGQEMIYSFTTTQNGPVQINLFNPTADVNMYLLDDLDQGTCMEASKNSGVSPEAITADLDAGTHYIVVDGVNGAVANYTLNVTCPGACRMDAGAKAFNTDCDGLNGRIEVNVKSGNSQYLYLLNGAVTDCGGSTGTNQVFSNLPAGMYDLTVLDMYGCSSTERIALYQGALNFLFTASANANNGSVQCNISGGLPPYDIYVDGNFITATSNQFYTIQNVSGGQHEVLVKDGSGCTQVQMVTSQAAAPPCNMFITTAPSAASCGAANGSISVDVINGAAPYNVNVNGTSYGPYSGSWFTIPNLVPGAYTVTVTDANSCTSSNSVTVASSGSNISLSASGNAASCNSPGSISVTVTGGTGILTATLNGAPAGTYNSSPFTISNVNPGTYTLSVTDGAGCSATTSVTVGGISGSVNIASVSASAQNCSLPGSIAVTLTSGTAPFSVTLSGTGAGTYNSNSFTIPNVGAGTYLLVVTDALGCTDQTTVTVGNSGSNLTVTATPSSANCGSPGSITINVAGGAGPYSVSLNGGVALNFPTNTFVYSNVTPGTYTVLVTDSNGCSGTTQVTVNSGTGNLTLSTNPSGAGCGSAGSISVNVFNGTAPYMATLNGLPAGGPFLTGSFTISNVNAGTYTLVITDNNGCTGTEVVTVSNSGGGPLSINAIPTGASCGSAGSIAVDVIGGSGPFTATLGGVPAGTFVNNWFTIPNVAPGTYTLSVTDVNGCIGTTQVTVSTIGGNLTINAIPTGASCGSTGSIAVDVIGGVGSYTATLNGIAAGTYPNNWFTLQNVSPGTYTLAITDGNGCTGTTQVIVSTTGGSLTVNATSTSAGCGSTGSIAVDVIGGAGPFTVTLNGVATGGLYPNNWFTLQNVAAGSYTVVVTDSNGCTGTTQVTVGGGSGGFAVTATPSGGGCGSTGTIGVDVLGGTPTYTIRLNGNIVGTSNATWFNVTNVPPGTYTLLITDINGCTGTTQVTVSGGGSGNLVATGTASPAGCGSTGSIQLDILGGTAPFDVYVNGSLVTTTTNRWYIIQNLSSGTYTVRIVDANGCEDTFVRTVSGSGGSFSITATPSSAGCGGYGSIAVDVIGGTPTYTVRLNGNIVGTSNNTWFNVVNVPAGTYTMTITDSNGCSSSTTVTVAGGNGSKIIVTAQSSTASCSNPASTQLDIVGGTAPFDIYLDGNFITNTTNRWYIIQNVSAGNHTVEVIDANGCSDTYKFKVVGSSGNISATATATSASCNSPGAIQLDITGGSAPFQIDLNGTFVTITTNRWYIIQNVPAGNHEITITDLHGCSTTIWKTVGGTNGNLSATATATAAGCNSPGSIKLDITGGAAPFDIELDGSFVVNTSDRDYTIQNVSAGSREIKITDKNGCSVTIWKTVNGGANISLTTTATNALCNNGGVISLTIGGGTGPFDIELDGNVVATTNDRNYDIQNVTQGQHTVVVTDKNGCTGTKNQHVSGSPGNIILTATHVPGTCSGGGKIMLDIIGGVGPFDVVLDGNFVINTNDRWYTLTNVGSGSHTIEITDANGCTASTVEVVGGTNGFTVFSDVINGTCGYNKGSISITLSGGTAPFEIYFDGTLQTTTSNRNYAWNNLAPGTYAVEVIDATGCSRTLTETITGSTGSAFTSTVTSASCNTSNGMIQIDITAGDAPFDVWLDGNVIATINATSYTYTGLAPGDYRIGIEDANDCESAEDVTIAGGSNIVVSANTTNASCSANDGVIDVNIAGGTAPFEIFLDGVSIATTSDQMYSFAGLSPGTYEVNVVDKFGCADNTIEKIQGAPPFSATVKTQKRANCGISNGILRIEFQSGDAPFSIFLDGVFLDTTSNTYRIRQLAQGTYDIRIEDANGCSQSFPTTLGGSPAVTFTGTVNSGSCGVPSGKIVLDITSGTAPFEIFVNGDSIGTTTINDFTINGLSAGTYDITVEDDKGCDLTIPFTVQSAASMTLTTSTSAAGCGGSSGSIILTMAGGTAPYNVFLDGTSIATTFNSTYTISGLMPDTYDLRVVDTDGCEATATETIQTLASVDFNTIITNASCGNQNGGIGITMIAGTAPYQIYLNGSLVQTTSAPAHIITDLAGGSYVVRVSDANNCDKSETVVVTGASSAISINATPFPENCGAADGNIAVDVIGGDPDFEIYLDGVLLTTISDRWYDAMGLTAGTYVLRVVDRNGCAALDTLVVAGNSSINVSTTTTNSSCGNTNGTITVNSTGGLAPYSIFLDGSSVGSTFNQFFTIAGLTPGMYDVRVEDSNGCTADLQETVNGGGSLAFTTSVTNEACGMLGSVQVNIQSGTAPYEIFVDGNLETTTSDNSTVLTDFFAGTYEIRVKDNAGCENIKQVTISSAPALNFIVNGMPDTCGNLGFAWVEIMSGSAPYTIEVDGILNGTTNTNSYTINDLSSGGYVVKVTDAQGCFDEVVVMINNTNNQPSAGFTYAVQTGGVIKFFSNNVNGNILWEFGDGTTSTELNPTHTFTVGQTYNVCIKATNTCGASNFCEMINIPTVYSTNLGFRVADIDGRPGEIIEIPVQVTNFEKVNRFQFTMKVGSGVYARMIEVDGGAMSNFDAHIMNDETITVKWDSDATAGTTLPDDYTIFTMKVELMGDRGDCTPVDFTTDPMSIEVVQSWFADPTLVVPNFFSGEVCINEMVIVSGNIHREDQNSIPDVEISCNGSQSVMSDVVTGDFTFPNVAMGDNCLLLPEKNSDARTALTVKDLLAVRAHILEQQILNSPYKIIAADLDRNQIIDGNDLSALGDLILANRTNLLSGDSWRFIPSNHVFDDPSNPFASVFPVMIDLRNVDENQSDNDFTGMKLGDVDYSLDLVSMTDTDYSMTDNVRFETIDQSVDSGQEFEMNFTSPNFENIRGFQFELSFDTDKFEFIGMTPGTLIGLDHNMVGTDRLNEGGLPILWYDRDMISNGVSRDNDEVLYRLKFRAKEASSTLEGFFELGQTLVPDLAVNVFDQNLDVHFAVGNAVSSTGEVDSALELVLHQNYPNPFSFETTIGFELPTPQDVRIELFDQSGKTIYVKESFYPEGYQQHVINGKELPISGIYFYRLTAGGVSETNKLIYMKR